MNQTLNRLKGGVGAAMAIMMGVLGTGCDSQGLSPASPGAAALADLDVIEEVRMSVIPEASGKEEQFRLEVAVSPSAMLRYPEAFNAFGLRTEGGITRLEDSGSGADLVKGDRVFSAWVDESCLSDEKALDAAAKDVSLTLSCDVSFISPGEECPGHGICPESAERSFLWGLIEYEVDVVTCWCFEGCNVDVEVSWGKTSDSTPPFSEPGPSSSHPSLPNQLSTLLDV